MSLLLDTHAWIWLMNGEDVFQPKTLTLIHQYAVQTGLLVSAISVWELGMLEAKDRLQLQKPALQWVNESLSLPGITFAPLTPEIAIESSHLPGKLHGDPADRIIVATARVNGFTLATRDEKLIEYARKGHISVLQI